MLKWKIDIFCLCFSLKYNLDVFIQLFVLLSNRSFEVVLLQKWFFDILILKNPNN